MAYSDDQGRHWSEPQEISGEASFCDFQFGDDDGACDEDQFSVPVVDPNDGTLYVAFENFNVESQRRNQLLIVRSTDGGQTFDAPQRITPVFDGAVDVPDLRRVARPSTTCAPAPRRRSGSMSTRPPAVCMSPGSTTATAAPPTRTPTCSPGTPTTAAPGGHRR